MSEFSREEIITHPYTCVVAELDENTEAWIGRVRNQLDPNYDVMPKEISLCGSSGLGSVSPGQYLVDVVSEIKNIIKSVKQELGKHTGFSFKADVHVFPGTQIHVLLPEPSNVFCILHEKLRESKIQFNACEREYGPHCTIYNGMFLEKVLEPRQVPERRNEIKEFFNNFKVPEKGAQIKSLALYECDLADPMKVYIKKITDIPFD